MTLNHFEIWNYWKAYIDDGKFIIWRDAHTRDKWLMYDVPEAADKPEFVKWVSDRESLTRDFFRKGNTEKCKESLNTK